MSISASDRLTGTVNEIIPVLLADRFTRGQALSGVDLLRRFADYFIFHQQPDQLTVSSNVNEALIGFTQNTGIPSGDQKVISMLARHQAGLFDKATSMVIIKKLQQAVLELPVINLETPVLLTRDHLARIGKWIRTHVDERAVIGIRLDPSTIGGCRIIWKGKQIEYTLRRYIRRKPSILLNIFDSLQAGNSNQSAT